MNEEKIGFIGRGVRGYARRICFLVGAVVLLFGRDQVKAAEGSTASSLVWNGNFATDSQAKGWPDGWGSKPNKPGKTWESEGGNHFIRLVSQQAGQLQVLYREVKLKPGAVKGLDVSMRYRTSGVMAGPKPSEDAHALVLFWDKAGNLLHPTSEPLSFSSGSASWSEVTQQIFVPEESTRMCVIMGLFYASGGTVDIGDISCVPLDEASSQKLAARLPPPAPEPESWVDNGTFEKARAAEDWPEGWGDPKPGMSWEQEDGKHFVRLVSQKPHESLMIEQKVPIKQGAEGIEVVIRFRATGIEHGDHEWFDARTIVHFLDAQGQQVADEGKNLDTIFTHKPAPTGWIDRAHFLLVPKDAAQLQLRAGLFQANAGTVDLAEFRVTPVSDADTELSKIAEAAYRSWKDDADAELDRRAEAEIEAQLAATGNLVPNGSFNLATKTPGWPDGWGGPVPGLSWEKESDVSFMRLTAQTPPKVVMLYKMIILKSGLKGVDVSLRYRLSGLVKGSR
jgi:endoglucanase